MSLAEPVDDELSWFIESTVLFLIAAASADAWLFSTLVCEYTEIPSFSHDAMPYGPFVACAVTMCATS